MGKKVFFACSMRGGYDTVSLEFLQKIPTALEELDLELMSKHQTQTNVIQKEDQITNISIHNRDYEWLEECDLMIAEITNPSLGVGAEISDAIYLGKPVIGLYQNDKVDISAYIRGKLEAYPKGHHARYTDLHDLKEIVTNFIDTIEL
jgi:nucleoside 2-deoxyribosyltransferase